jgi:hypothetical protein
MSVIAGVIKDCECGAAWLHVITRTLVSIRPKPGECTKRRTCDLDVVRI